MINKNISNKTVEDIFDNSNLIWEDHESRSPLTLKWAKLHMHGREDLVSAFLDLKKRERLLVLGIGTGQSIKKFDSFVYITGLDISRKMCKLAKKNLPEAKIVRGNMTNLPFRRSSFDKILIVYSLVYVKNKLKVFKECSRILDHNGDLIIFEPNKLGLKTIYRFFSYFLIKNNPLKKAHHRIATTQSLTFFGYSNLAKKAGFKIQKWRSSFDTPLFPPVQQKPFYYISLFFLDLWRILGCKHWGLIPGLRIFGDFFVIKYGKVR